MVVTAPQKPIPVKVFTMPQLAKKFHVHRTTLLRMEQRGDIAKPGWVDTGGFNGRVYTEEEAQLVEYAVGRMRANKVRAEDGIVVLAEQIRPMKDQDK